jgi:hypothetical protein
LKTIAIVTIFTLSFTFQIHAIILKFIFSKKLKIRKSTEYFSIVQDGIKSFQNKIKAIISANTKNNILNHIQTIKKFFVNILFINFILSYSFLEFISENNGKSSQKIGHISIKGIFIILRYVV